MAKTHWKHPRNVVRALSLPDRPAPLLTAIDARPAEVVGHKLFTLMISDHATGETEHVYDNEPDF